MESKVFARALDSIQLPIQRFLETGLWDPNTGKPDYDIDVSEVQVRKICRKIASEQKRPFIQCYTVPAYYDYVQKDGKYQVEELDAPMFHCGKIVVPKRQYLTPLVAPLLLIEKGHKTLINRGHVKYWWFQVYDQKLWDAHYQYVLNDPECRRARRLTS